MAAGGGKWGPVWAIGMNAGVLALHAPYVRDFAGFDRPWAQPGAAAERVADLAVQELAMGAGYVALGTVPPRAVPLVAGPVGPGCRIGRCARPVERHRGLTERYAGPPARVGERVTAARGARRPPP